MSNINNQDVINYVKAQAETKSVILAQFLSISAEAAIPKNLITALANKTADGQKTKIVANATIINPVLLSKIRSIKNAVYTYMQNNALMVGTGGCYSVPTGHVTDVMKFLNEQKALYDAECQKLFSEYPVEREKLINKINANFIDPSVRDSIIAKVPTLDRLRFGLRANVAKLGYVFDPQDQDSVENLHTSFKEINERYLHLLDEQIRKLCNLYTDGNFKCFNFKNVLDSSKDQLLTMDLALRGCAEYPIAQNIKKQFYDLQQIVNKAEHQKETMLSKAEVSQPIAELAQVIGMQILVTKTPESLKQPPQVQQEDLFAKLFADCGKTLNLQDTPTQELPSQAVVEEPQLQELNPQEATCETTTQEEVGEKQVEELVEVAPKAEEVIPTQALETSAEIKNDGVEPVVLQESHENTIPQDVANNGADKADSLRKWLLGGSAKPIAENPF